MRAYVITTGVIFALLVLMHLARVLAEGPGLVRDPVFVIFTGLSAALAGWSLWLVVSARKERET